MCAARRPQPVLAEDRSRQVVIAEVARPHGLSGELRLKIYNLDSKQLWNHPEVRVVPADAEARTMRVEGLRRMPNAVLMRLEGVSNHEQAEALRGAKIEVPRAALAALEDDEYYICDLERCEAWLGGERIGLIREVLSYPTCEVLVIERDGAGEGSRRLEVPLHGDYVAKVDTETRRVELSRIDDLP